MDKWYEVVEEVTEKAGLNFDAIKSLNIIVPPIELQDDFVKNIYFIDKHKLLIID